MAFGGVIASTTPAGAVNGGTKSDYTHITGLTLTAFVANPPVITNGDTGQFTTGTPVANQTQFPATFGPGAGNWTAAMADFVSVVIEEQNPATQGAGGQIAHSYVSAIAISGGNLVITIANNGLLISNPVGFKVTYLNPN